MIVWISWVFGLIISAVFAVDTSCEADGLHYQCIDNSKKCIPITWLCDGRSDCLNGDDENGKFCEPRGSKSNVFERGNCPPRQFECEDLFGRKKCVLEEWRCDRHIDCKGGLDEQDCDYSKRPETQIQSLNNLNLFENRFSCSESQFRCKTIKECLPSRSMVCDGRKDCIDSSDELECDESTSQTKLGTVKQAIANKIIDGRTQLKGLSSTQILSIPSSSRPHSTTNEQRISSISRIQPTSQTNLTTQPVSRGSTESIPISPAKFSAVSASGNKPQRVKMEKIAGNGTLLSIGPSSQPNQLIDSSSQSLPTSNQPTVPKITTSQPVKFVKREKIISRLNLAYPQYNLIADYPPIIPQL